MRHIAFVGSRDFADRLLIRRCIERLLSDGPFVLVSGGARGADSIAANEARSLGVTVTVYPADWERYGKAAGFLRNETIVRDSEQVIAFFAPGPRSRGTAHSVQLAIDAGIPVHTFHEGEWTTIAKEVAIA